MSSHEHVATSSQDTVYRGGALNPRAAGWMTITEHCACGARRVRHENRDVEWGEWVEKFHPPVLGQVFDGVVLLARRWCSNLGYLVTLRVHGAVRRIGLSDIEEASRQDDVELAMNYTEIYVAAVGEVE